MPIPVRCPGCEMQYKLADHLAGKKIRCKGCNQVIPVPGGAQPSAPNAIAAKPSRPPASAAGPPTKTRRDGAVEAPRKKVQPPPLDDDEPDSPRPRKKSKRKSSARKGMPVAVMVALIVGGVVVAGGVAFGAYLVLGNKEPAKDDKEQYVERVDPRLKWQKEQEAAEKDAKKGKGSIMDEPKGKMPGKKKGGPDKGQPKGEPKVDTPQEIPLQIDGPVSFAKHIKPLLGKYCIGCHGAGKQFGGASFVSMSTIQKGGKSGVPLIVPNDPDKSYMVSRVEASQKPMPPKGNRLNESEKKLLRQWIMEGAKDDSSQAGTPALGGLPELSLGHSELRRSNAVDPSTLFEFFDMPRLQSNHLAEH
jgi:Planctomycete cytochrome C